MVKALGIAFAFGIGATFGFALLMNAACEAAKLFELGRG
jgi:hypothetical protein